MKAKTVIIIFAACGALFIVAIGSCAGFFFFALHNMNVTLSPTIDELFTAIDNGTFAETYDTLASAELRQTVTRQQYEDLGLSIKTRLGSLKSKSLSRFNVRQFNATTYADVAYNANFEKGSATISGQFRKQGQRWMILSFHVESPEFQKDLATGTCPYCGKPHTADAKFCPNCGKPLTSD